MARIVCASAFVALALLVLQTTLAHGATVRSTPRLQPPPRRVAAVEPLRVYRFALMGPLTATRCATAVIVEVSDDRWTAREFGFVEVVLPEEFDAKLGASGGLARWNQATEQFEALSVEP